MRIEGDIKRVHSSGPHANADGGKVEDGIWTLNDRNMSFVNMPDASHACYCSTNLADIYFTVYGAPVHCSYSHHASRAVMPNLYAEGGREAPY